MCLRVQSRQYNIYSIFLHPMCLDRLFFLRVRSRSFHSGFASICARSCVCVCVEKLPSLYHTISFFFGWSVCARCVSRLIIVFIYLNIAVVVGVIVVGFCCCDSTVFVAAAVTVAVVILLARCLVPLTWYKR